MDIPQADLIKLGAPEEEVIKIAEKLRHMEHVMHLGPACPSGGALLDRTDGLYYMLSKTGSDHKQFDTKIDKLRAQRCVEPEEYEVVLHHLVARLLHHHLLHLLLHILHLHLHLHAHAHGYENS